METINYLGWQDSVRLSNSAIELVIPSCIGPRIMHVAPLGGENLLGIDKDLKGKIEPSDNWVNYGGHRLWHAPELKPFSYEPDNGPVEIADDAGGVLFSAPTDPVSQIRKQIRVTLASGSTPVAIVDHILTNNSDKAVEMAPWGVTVVASGGRVFLPHEEFFPHGHNDEYLAARPMALWAYTDMSDPRWTWGTHFTQRCDETQKMPQKVGAYVTEGWGAYTRPSGETLIKFIAPPEAPPAQFPDFGSNFEIFTKGDFQELEALGALSWVAPGGSTALRETWVVLQGEALPEGDAALKVRMDSVLGDAAKLIAKGR